MTNANFMKALIVCIVLAAIGFLFIDNYEARAGLIWNVINGKIRFDMFCGAPQLPRGAMLTSNNCGFVLPYKWLMSSMIVLVTVLVFRRWR